MSEITRRTGLGALLGGIFAGPEVAKQGIETIKKYNYKGSPVSMDDPQPAHFNAAYDCDSVKAYTTYPPTYGIEEKEESQIQHMRSRITEIKDKISGKWFKDNKDMFERNHTKNLDRIPEKNINSLRSVSEVHKYQMVKDAKLRIAKENMQEYAEKELSETYTNWAKSKIWGKISDLFE